MIEQQTTPALDDVQGNILTRYEAGFATYLFYRVDLAGQARQWLGALFTRITTEKTYQEEKKKCMEETPPSAPPSMLNIAITYQGLKALGLSPTSLQSFPVEFQEGMRKRAARLCDFGESQPEYWDPPLGSPQIHILVLIHATNAENLKKLEEWVEEQIPREGGKPIGLELLKRLAAEGLPGHKEHFGFRDGISQPWIEGTHPGPPTQPYGGKRVKPDRSKPTPENSFAPLRRGEFLLGHKDELDRVPQSLIPSVLGANGTYLVLRKLYQDVAQFRAEMAKQAEYVFGDKAAKDRLAALTVGRWPSGCPVDRSPARDDEDHATEQAINAFYFDDDPNGALCPVGAHIRRMNARDLKLDAKGNLIVEPMSTRHRMIRRSLPYGPPLPANVEADDKNERGLILVALVADIERQFEFVQRSWINDGDPFRLDSADRDPLCGNNRDGRDRPPADQVNQPHAETKRKFSVPAATRLPWALNLPEFVKTRGGEYFFVPSTTALQGLASLSFSSFRQEYAVVEKTNPDPASRSRAQSDLIRGWLILRPKEMLDELRAMAEGQEGKIFHMEGYTVFGKPFYTTSPPIAIVTKYEDVLEVLDWSRHPGAFTVKLYRDQMEVPPPRPSRGQFILGKELDDPLYKKEMPVLANAVRSSPVSQLIPKILADILDPIFNGLKQRRAGKLDVIQELAWPIPLGINAEYFGVRGPDPQTFKRWLRNIYRDLFLNLRRNPEWSKLADIAVSEMNPYLDGVIQGYDMGNESVLKQLILEDQKANPKFDPYFVRRNIMGLIVGVVETSLKAIARTIDQFLRRPQQLKEAQEAAARDDKAAILKYTYEAMRFNPQNHVLFRLCGKDTTIATGTPRQIIIRQGTIVFVATLPAMFDEQGPFKQPNEFKTDRNLSDYLFFGHDGHECMGRFLMPLVFQELFVRLLKMKSLKRANDDPFDPLDLFPERFLVEFEW
jgi:Dyp-type peroxidase family